MKSSLTKKFLTCLVTTVILLNPLQLRAQEMQSKGMVDESLQDLTVVLASGAVGAVLGLSTLSFVETPKDHMKNIAIGGAIGIVVGVGFVIFGQASKQTITEAAPSLKMTPDTVESLARVEFSKQKIAESYLTQPTASYTFTF